MIDYTGRTLLLREACWGAGKGDTLGEGEKKVPSKREEGKEELQRLATTVPGLKKLRPLLYTEMVGGSWGAPRALFDQLGNSKAGQTGRRGSESCASRDREMENEKGRESTLIHLFGFCLFIRQVSLMKL